MTTWAGKPSMKVTNTAVLQLLPYQHLRAIQDQHCVFCQQRVKNISMIYREFHFLLSVGLSADIFMQLDTHDCTGSNGLRMSQS